jgi:hypothetical protein
MTTLNTFLSNFAEALSLSQDDITWLNFDSKPTEIQLVRFALEHAWWNDRLNPQKAKNFKEVDSHNGDYGLYPVLIPRKIVDQKIDTYFAQRISQHPVKDKNLNGSSAGYLSDWGEGDWNAQYYAESTGEKRLKDGSFAVTFRVLKPSDSDRKKSRPVKIGTGVARYRWKDGRRVLLAWSMHPD